jgi:hypothetical protein
MNYTDIILQILLSIVAFICLLGGLNLMIKGSTSFLADGIPAQPILDNLFRFMVGIYFSMGFLIIYLVVNIKEINTIIYFIGIVVTFSGLGRLYSVWKLGSAGKYFFNIMLFEIGLGILIMVLQYLR